MTEPTRSGKSFGVGGSVREGQSGVFREVALPRGGVSRILSSNVYSDAISHAGKLLARTLTEQRERDSK